jgi:pyroglutamyl-peptidase
MRQTQILLTGFGPFPGVADNPSARLIEALADDDGFAPEDSRLHARVLPTEWGAVASLIPDLLESMQPHVTIHFGVSRQARSLRIERSAHNRIVPRLDAAGVLPARRVVAVNGPPRLDSAVSSSRLAATLRDYGLPANSSVHAGTYLCNFLYYHSLAWAKGRSDTPQVLFVHVPLTQLQGGPLKASDLHRAAKFVLDFMLNPVEAPLSESLLTASDRR